MKWKTTVQRCSRFLNSNVLFVKFNNLHFQKDICGKERIYKGMIIIFEGDDVMSLEVKKYDLQQVDISGSKWTEVNADRLEIENVSLANTKVHNTNMSNLHMNDINMGNSHIQNVNLSGVKIKNANFSHALIDHVHLFGTQFRQVVFPVEGDGNFKTDGQYKPVSFEQCDLSNGRFTNCNLSNIEITNCDISGLKINGILIKDLLEKSDL